MHRTMNGQDISTILVKIHQEFSSQHYFSSRSNTCNAIGIYKGSSTSIDSYSQSSTTNSHWFSTECKRSIAKLNSFFECSFQAHKFLITVELLLGDIPDKATFHNPQLKRSLDPYYQLTLGKNE